MSLDADVCVVGAGFAGLTAALRLTQAGQTVVVFEARDRVGGRTWTEFLSNGVWLDRGGAWIGYGQDRIYALAKEMGIETYPSFKEGDNLFVVKGKAHRYQGVIPGGLNPFAAIIAGLALKRIDKLGKSIPIESPWTAKNAIQYDGLTMAQWLNSWWNVPSQQARDMLRLLMIDTFAVPPEELSLLGVLFSSHSLGSYELAANTKTGTQKDRIVGGMQSIANAIAKRLGDSIQLSSPVRSIEQDETGVTVKSDSKIVRAKRAIVAIPPSLSAHISYKPSLPTERALLTHQMPAGSSVKIGLVYDDAFWRADGLSGQSAGLGVSVVLTLDGCTTTATPGILTAILAGPSARQLTQLDAAERKQIILKELTLRFGPKAAKPVSYIEQDWTQEEWSRGCYSSHFLPGVLTGFGSALRKPFARIHWAGTETATKSFISIDGAVRSGERVAAEILSA